MDVPIGKTLPYSLEAEQAVLGGMILSNQALAQVVQNLRMDDFYMESHKVIFDAISGLFNTNTPVDVITLSQALGDNLEKVGGMSYIANMAAMVITTENMKQYIEIVKNKAMLRRLIETSSEISEMCYNQSEEVPLILDAAEQKIFNLLEGRGQKGLSHIKEVVFETLANLEILKKNGGRVVGVPTGFKELDEITAGLQKSDLILIAARPAMGKTAFALNIAEHAAIHAKVPVAIFNLEMSKQQLVNRIICSEALIEGNKLKIGDLSPDDMTRMAHKIGELTSAPIYLDDAAGATVSEIRAKCRRLKAEKNLGLVVIDYLQLMQSSKGGRENRQQEVSEISRSLKILAKELNIPVITLSQLSRSPEARTDKRPMLSDLRESGAIEQDADIVMFLYRDEYYNEDSEEKNVAECIIAKHRNGSTGTVKLGYRGDFVKFMDLSVRREG